MQGIRSGVIPFVWAEEGGGVTPELADQLKGMLLTPLWYITRIIALLAIVLPFTLIFLLILRFTRGPSMKQKVTPGTSPVKPRNITAVSRMSAASGRTQHVRNGSVIPPPPPPPLPMAPLNAASLVPMTALEIGRVGSETGHQGGYVGLLYGVPMVARSASRASSRTSLASSQNAGSQTDLTTAQLATRRGGPPNEHMLRLSEEEGERSPPSTSSSSSSRKEEDNERGGSEEVILSPGSPDDDDPRRDITSEEIARAMNQ